MVCVWLNFECVIHYEFVENGKSIDSKLFVEQLERMLFSLYSKYPLFKTDKFYLQQDNTNPHTHKNTFNYINSVDELELIPHPYSPDLVPSDYYLFRSFAHFLKEKLSKTMNKFKIL